jgi:hypothetical protein
VKVAFLYLRLHPFEEALAKVRAGIQRLSAANGVEETPTSGYNETTTHVFLQLVAATTYAYGPVFATPDADRFCDAHPHLMAIAVIAILAAILFPVFAQARDKARQTQGLWNARQIAMSVAQYVQDYDETFYWQSEWKGVVDVGNAAAGARVT